MVGRGASLDGRLFLGGTDGSNPVPSSGESCELIITATSRKVPPITMPGPWKPFAPVPVQLSIRTSPFTVTLPSSRAETHLAASTLPPIVDEKL